MRFQLIRLMRMSSLLIRYEGAEQVDCVAVKHVSQLKLHVHEAHRSAALSNWERGRQEPRASRWSRLHFTPCGELWPLSLTATLTSCRSSCCPRRPPLGLTGAGELGVDDIQNLISPYCSNTATDDIIVVQTALGDGLMTTCSVTEISLLAIFSILASCSCTLFLSRPTRVFISDWTLFRSRTSRLPDDVDFLRSGWFHHFSRQNATWSQTFV